MGLFDRFKKNEAKEESNGGSLTDKQDTAIKWILNYLMSPNPTLVQIDMAIVGAQMLCDDPSFTMPINLGPELGSVSAVNCLIC
ncbi:MAG: hypothetical protein IJL02_07445 [Methanobrevibacter sp.]|uniref:hypothetical protein n=1 Tax=Methanobrevibacter sp. TaxID=66852 RepID=UPI0025CCDE01|nr:hypothetical protein [Methanobrevibacter sp.]MBQ6099680.1 hypothetical protein [Methanobrevibacter sp.]